MKRKEIPMDTFKHYDELTGKFIDVANIEDVYEELEMQRTQFQIRLDTIRKEILENFDTNSEELYWDKKVQTNTIQEPKFVAMVKKAFVKHDEE